MLRVNSEDGRLVHVLRTDLEPAELPHAPELRNLVLGSADAVVADLDAGLLVLDTDFPIRDGETPRADLICVEHDGTVVVLALPKEGVEQLAEAIAVSAQVARLDGAALTRRLADEQRSRLSEFLSGPFDTLNHRQRIVLFSDGHEHDLVAAVEWLRAGGVHLSVCDLGAMRDSDTQDTYLFLGDPGQRSNPLSIVRDQDLATASAEREEREQELARLRESLDRERRERHLVEERYGTVSSLSPVGIFHANPDGEYLFVSSRWSEIAGLGKQEAAGRGWADAVHPEDKDRVLSSWASAAQEGRRFKTECRLVRPDGSSWVLIEADVQTGEGGLVIGIAGTVTELHRSRLDQPGASAQIDPSQ